MSGDIAGVLSRGKEYEKVIALHDPMYNGIVRATEIVLDFIRTHDLVIYGGTAIDMALRLHGDQEYPDDLLPDLDFFSPTNVKHAYELADILYADGFPDARAINAQHMETMRVDIGGNHFIADISYRPKDMFDKIPYHVYNNVRIIHPVMQRLDIHSSLAFPYDNPPEEVVFARWSKDLRRFNAMAKYYPVEIKGRAASTKPTIVPIIRHGVFTGLIAYAAIYHQYKREMGGAGKAIPRGVIPAHIEVEGNNIIVDTLGGSIGLVHYDPIKCARELRLKNICSYEPYTNIIPPRTEGVDDNMRPYTIYSTHNRMMCVSSVDIGGVAFRVSAIQYLLMNFLALSFVTAPNIAAAYLARYNSLILMIESAPDVRSSITSLTIKTYGHDNINLAREVAINRIKVDLGQAAPFKIPRNYYPNKGGRHPDFDPEQVVFFRESGRPIKEDIVV
jgi:hypothetical protein